MSRGYAQIYDAPATIFLSVLGLFLNLAKPSIFNRFWLSATLLFTIIGFYLAVLLAQYGSIYSKI